MKHGKHGSSPVPVHPITLNSWYEHTDGTYGYYVNAASGTGPKLISNSCPDYECVSRDQEGKIYAIGWPALSPLATAAGVDQDDLTPELADAAIWKLRTLRDLGRRAVNELTRRVRDRGIDLTHEQAGELGDQVLDWMRQRLELAITTDDAGVHARRRDVHCECGDWSGEHCQWTGPRDQTVMVEFMPRHLRGAHSAAGQRGTYPSNGAQRIRVERSCAERMLATDGEWCSACGRAER